MRSRIRTSVAARLLALAAAAAAAPGALACSCVPPSPATIREADVVFTGTATARSDPRAGRPELSTADPITYSFAIDGELKGAVDATARVVTARDSASCGVDLEIGTRYLVIADRDDDGDLSTGLCQGTQALPAGARLPEFARSLEAPPERASAAWPVPTRVSRPADGTDPPQVALTPAGEATLLWSRTTYVPGTESFATSRLFAASRPAGGTFGPPERLSDDDELAVSGAVAAAGETELAVWVRLGSGASGPAVVARVRPAGAPWGPAETLDSASAGLGLPQPSVAGTGSGDALAVWATGDRGLRAAAFAPAGGWGRPATVAAGVVPQQLSVALGPDGTAIVAWWAREDAGAVTRVAVRAPGGEWGAPATLSRPFEPLGDLFPSEPPHVSAGAGEGLVVWTEPERTFRGSVHAARVGVDGSRRRWRLSTGAGAGDAEGALDAARRATVVWSQAGGRRAGLRWTAQDAGGRWGAPRAFRTTGSPCGGGFAPRVAATPTGNVHAIWTENHRRGSVVVAAARRPGEGFSQPRAISRADVSPLAALAASEAGALAAWSRATPGARARPFIEAAISDAAAPRARGLVQFEAPRLDGVRAPSRIGLREPLPIRFHLSRPARVEVRFRRIRPSSRYVGPFRRGGRAGANAIQIPSWSVARRRLGPGVYEMYIEAMTAQRASCTITRRLVVRGEPARRPRRSGAGITTGKDRPC